MKLEKRILEDEDKISDNVIKVLKTMKPGEKCKCVINVDAFIMNEKQELSKFDPKSSTDVICEVKIMGYECE